MCKFPSVCLLALSVSTLPAWAESDDWHEVIAKLDKSIAEFREEEQSIYERIMILDEQSQVQEAHIRLLHARLTAMNGGVSPISLPDGPLADADAEGGHESPEQTGDHQQREDDLISECADRIAILQAKDGKTGTAFFVPHEGKTRVFASAPWVAENGNFSLSDIYGNAIAFGHECSSPVGLDLLGLHPEKEGLPSFELAAPNEIPAVGSRILVVVVDAESKGLAGVGGAIRGIGPDTLEIDAELTPEMSGAPILALDTGKVIGIVADQITGVADDWALGTRHEGSRNFAVRLDRIGEWETGDLTRFAKEAAFIGKIQKKSSIALIAHRMLESERWFKINKTGPMEQMMRPPRMQGESYEDYQERTKDFIGNSRQANESWKQEQGRMSRQSHAAIKDAEKHPTNPHIVRAKAWCKELGAAGKLEPGGSLDRNLTFIYRNILTDLSEREPDPSAHLSSYHKRLYRSVIANRDEGIKTLTAEANRLGQ